MAEAPTYTFKTTEEFRKSFSRLSSEQQKLAKEKLKVFKANPFDPSLRTHKINRLTALRKQTVHSVSIAGDLRALFVINGSEVVSIDIGTHDIYKK